MILVTSYFPTQASLNTLPTTTPPMLCQPLRHSHSIALWTRLWALYNIRSATTDLILLLFKPNFASYTYHTIHIHKHTYTHHTYTLTHLHTPYTLSNIHHIHTYTHNTHTHTYALTHKPYTLTHIYIQIPYTAHSMTILIFLFSSWNSFQMLQRAVCYLGVFFLSCIIGRVIEPCQRLYGSGIVG